MKRALAILLAAAVAAAVDASYADDVSQTVATIAPAQPPASSSAADCPEACIEIYAPVCGSDGVTYDNSCFLLVAQCKSPASEIVQVADSACAADSPEQTAEPTAETSGEADDCGNRMCPMVYSPVCGSDGKTYSNACMLGIAQCTKPTLAVVGDGACEARASSSADDLDASVGSAAGSNGTATPRGDADCPEACAMIYEPVCGSDGKSYSNACTLQVARCSSPTLNLTQVSEGECAGAASSEAANVEQTAV